MVRHKSALYGLVLSLAVLGMAACEDKQDIVIPPEPDPPLQISVTPAAITIEEGETAQMVAQVTGGAAGGDKSVSWSSSNTSVATVAGNGNVVTITGVSEGTSTIRATATADANVSAAAVVTVESAGGVPPTVSIKSITFGVTNTPVVITNVFGQIEITLNLDVPVGTSIDRVEILADGEVIYTQSFAGIELGLAVDEAQSAVELVASWNTAEFDRSQLGTAGNVQGDWPNGDTEIQVQVIGPQGTITASTSTTIVLNNTPFIYARLNLPTTSALNSTSGLLWYTGDIVAEAMGVRFNENTAQDIASITMTNTGSDVATVTDGTAGDGFDLTLQKSGGATASRINALETGGVTLSMNSVTAGGAVGPSCIVAENSPTPLNLACVGPANQVPLASALNWDNVAPTVTLFDISPYTLGCATTAGGFPPTPNACYVSGNPATPAFPFQVGAGFFAHTDAGVGSPTATFMAGAAGSLIPVTTGQDLAESVVPSYQLSATSCDKLNNCATVYAGPPTGVGFPATGIVGTVLTSATGAQLFGIDSTDPTATVDNATPNNSAYNGGAGPLVAPAPTPTWTISFSDAGVGPSGFSAMPVSVQLKRTLPAGATCYVPDNPFTATTALCTTSSGAINYQADDGVVSINTVFPAGEGYWQLTSFVRDQAKNFSKPNTDRITLQDVTNPVIGGISGPSSLPGGANVTFTAGLGDNIDLGWIEPYLTYGLNQFQYPDVALGAYGVADGMVSNTTGNFTVNGFVRAVEPTLATGRAGGVVNEASQVDFDVFDVAGNMANAFVNITPAVQFAAGGPVPSLTAAPTDVIFAPANAAHGNFIHQAPSAPQVCRGTSTACGASPPASTVLSATMTGPNATFANPFSRVDFYYQDPVNARWYYVGSGAASASDNTVTSTRTWTYSYTWTVTGLTASDGTPLVNAAVPLVAVGVHSSGSALISTGTPQTIDITAT